MKLVTILISLALVPLCYGSELKLEKFVSEKSIISNKEKYIISMPDNSGYEGRKVWATLGKFAAKTQDSNLMRAFFSKFYSERNAQVSYRRDLLEIFAHNPSFFISYSRKAFKKTHCLSWLFDSNLYQINNSDFAKISSNNNNSTSEKAIIDRISKTKLSLKDQRACQKAKEELGLQFKN